MNDGITIMQAAKIKKIEIPGLCGHPDLPVKANCRVCVVEIAGRKNLVTACSTKVAVGMDIKTDTDRVKRARNLNLELIYSEHIEKCATCIWRFECKLLKTAEKYKILITTFKDRKARRKIHKFKNAVEIDGTQCIDCRNCIDACSLLQNINYLELCGKGVDQEVTPTRQKGIKCILCGQCALHCPVSAAQEQTHWEVVDKAILNKPRSGKVVIAQLSPEIGVSMGEDFDLPPGKVASEHVAVALKEIGFDFIFSTGAAADINTIIEAKNLVENLIHGKNQPLITSSCCAGVKYIKDQHPELALNLSSTRSPHIINGGLIKTYWAAKAGVNPKDIIVVSIAGCTAKKYGAARKEMKINNLWPVDYVLTARELSFMLKKNNINLADIKITKKTKLAHEGSGAGIIFSGSGGVAESVLRTAQAIITQTNTGRLTKAKL